MRNSTEQPKRKHTLTNSQRGQIIVYLDKGQDTLISSNKTNRQVAEELSESLGFKVSAKALYNLVRSYDLRWYIQHVVPRGGASTGQNPADGLYASDKAHRKLAVLAIIIRRLARDVENLKRELGVNPASCLTGLQQEALTRISHRLTLPLEFPPDQQTGDLTVS